MLQNIEMIAQVESLRAIQLKIPTLQTYCSRCEWPEFLGKRPTNLDFRASLAYVRGSRRQRTFLSLGHGDTTKEKAKLGFLGTEIMFDLWRKFCRIVPTSQKWESYETGFFRYKKIQPSRVGNFCNFLQRPSNCLLSGITHTRISFWKKMRLKNLVKKLE